MNISRGKEGAGIERVALQCQNQKIEPRSNCKHPIVARGTDASRQSRMKFGMQLCQTVDVKSARASAVALCELRGNPKNFGKIMPSSSKNSMNNPVLSSILIPTVLMGIGLFFFIRASAKDRTQQAILQSSQTEASLAAQLREYFTRRAYRLAKVEPETEQAIFEGNVRPSWFLAIFLTLLAAIGLSCTIPIVSILAPKLSWLAVGSVVLSPLAGVFYWRKADRLERVSVAIKSLESESSNALTQIVVRAHRDELANLKQALSLQGVEE
ncbi:MAG: cofactor assembly of complex C subunit B [Cyanobacteriota bacterium]|nr:cofactor assembly of complex C subunit B [Cyanobacteriota bacterium]